MGEESLASGLAEACSAADCDDNSNDGSSSFMAACPTQIKMCRYWSIVCGESNYTALAFQKKIEPSALLRTGAVKRNCAAALAK